MYSETNPVSESYPIPTVNPEADAIARLGQAAGQDVLRQSRFNELLGLLNKFILESVSWRRSSFETQWHLYERNSDAIYDPALLVKKEYWQSRAFIPLTPSHRENIKAALFKMLVGARPPVEMRPRVEQPNDQSDNIRDLIVREMERSRFEVEIDKVLDDASTYGSGFCRIRWADETEDRIVRTKRPVTSAPKEVISNFLRGLIGKESWGNQLQQVTTYRGVKMEWLNIWDIFPDPKALEVKGNQIAYRFKMGYGELIKGVKEGYYFPEAVDLVQNMPSREWEPVDKNIVLADRSTAPSNPPRSDYGRKQEYYEWYGRLPKKWVLWDQVVPDPETLIPARVIFHPNVIVCIEPSGAYDGEPPIYKMDYLPVAWQFYGRGIPEMLKDLQEVINETVNQRIDNVALVLNRMWGVIEKALVTSDDLVSKPGGMIRIDARFATDVRQALQPLDTPEVTQSAYKDVQEIERYAQERTSANRVTLGTNGLVNDANRTATGLEILRQSAGEKFAYIGMVMEFRFMYQVFRAYWMNLYANIQPDDVLKALGPERSASFQLLSPEQIEEDYQYEPQGIFTMENKALTTMKLQAIVQQFGQQPWFSWMGAFDKECKSNNIDPEALKLSPQEMQTMMQAQQHLQMANAPMPKAAGPNNNATNPSPGQASSGGQVGAQQ